MGLAPSARAGTYDKIEVRCTPTIAAKWREVACLWRAMEETGISANRSPFARKRKQERKLAQPRAGVYSVAMAHMVWAEHRRLCKYAAKRGLDVAAIRAGAHSKARVKRERGVMPDVRAVRGEHERQVGADDPRIR